MSSATWSASGSSRLSRRRLEGGTRSCTQRTRTRCRAADTPPDSSAGARADSALEALRQQLPFVASIAAVASDVTYEGPLCRLTGAAEYTRMQSFWATSLASRLRDFRVQNLSLFRLTPTQATLRWRASFAAPLPPRAAQRLAEVGESPPPQRPDGYVDVNLSLTSDFQLDAATGRVMSHTERITDDFGVRATIARFEFLQARRPNGILSPLWYYDVLRYTSLEEAADAQGASPDDDDIQRGFALMVGRNFGLGLALGVVVYVAIRAAKLAALQSTW